MNGHLRNEAGSILIVSLWIVALLSLFAIGLTSVLRLSIREEGWAVRFASSNAQLVSLAEFAALRLRQDEDLDVDSLQEAWADTYHTSSETLAAAFDSGKSSAKLELSIIAVDESAKININLASKQTIIEALKEASSGLNADQVAVAILDWRDPDHDGPAEEEYAIGPERVYAPANVDLQHVEELLFIGGITPELFFGEDENHNGKLDRWEDDAEILSPSDNADGVLQPGLIDLFTVHGNGSINVNGASEWVLRSAFRVALLPSEAQEAARAVQRKRQGPDGEDGTEDDSPFLTDEDIAEVLQSAYERILNAGIELVTVSDAFRFYIRIEHADPRHVIEGDLLLLREGSAVMVREWRVTT